MLEVDDQDMDWESSQALPTAVPDRSQDADVIANLGVIDPLLRDATDRALLIRAVFGDNEAYLADNANEIVASLQVIATTWRTHPERVLAGLLNSLDPVRRVTTIATVRDMLDRLETTMAVPLPAVPVPAMLTGTRTIGDTAAVLAALIRVIRILKADEPDLVIISGGAQGADQLWAGAAIATDTPFSLYLPNWAYAANYGQEAQIDALLASELCFSILYAVDRPEVPDWRARWGKEGWWKDNFVRNDTMVKAGRKHVICGPQRPEVIFTDGSIKGGTAACVRAMRRLGVKEAVYVNSTNPSDIVTVSWP